MIAKPCGYSPRLPGAAADHVASPIPPCRSDSCAGRDGVHLWQCRRLLARRLGKGLRDWRRAQGHDARVLEEHPRRGDQGGARARGPRDQGEHHLEGPAARGRPRAAGAGDRGLPQPGHERHRARAPRRARAGASGGRSEARRDPDGDHGLGSGLGSDRQLRGHRQPERRRARGRPHGAAASATRAACCCCDTRKGLRAPRFGRMAFCSG